MDQCGLDPAVYPEGIYYGIGDAYYDEENLRGLESYEVAPKTTNDLEDAVPIASCVVHMMQKQISQKPHVILFDSGSTRSWWKRSSLPKGCVPRVVEEQKSATLAGNLSSKCAVTLQNISFPEFFKTQVVDEIEC